LKQTVLGVRQPQPLRGFHRYTYDGGMQKFGKLGADAGFVKKRTIASSFSLPKHNAEGTAT
jgi:hypothetical protein